MPCESITRRASEAEAALASVQHGFGPLGLPRIIGRVHKENQASIAVLEKVGMRYWKTAACEHDAEVLFYAVDRKADRARCLWFPRVYSTPLAARW